MFVLYPSELCMIRAIVQDSSDQLCLLAPMPLLSNLWTRLSYQSNASREQDKVFALVQSLVEAQFQLADDELSRRIWQEIADQNIPVERVENLLYCCFFQDDPVAMKEADEDYLRRVNVQRAIETHQIGVFEHC